MELDRDTMAQPCRQEDMGDYDLKLRLLAVFIVLGVSALAVYTPLYIQKVVKSSESNERAETILTVVKQFGGGVILGTAFIHLLPDAFDAFNNPCIGATSYDAWPGAIAMLGLLLTFLIETMGHRIISSKIKNVHLHSHHDLEREPLLPSNEDGNEATTTTTTVAGDASHAIEAQLQVGSATKIHYDHTHTHSHVGMQGPKAHGHEHGHSKIPFQSHRHMTFDIDDDEESGDSPSVKAELSKSIDRLSLYVLEAGVVFHSVLIGMTLSVTIASAYTSLLVVILFHQFFEGVALGTRIIDVESISRFKKFIFCISFCLVTPFGMLIGIVGRSVVSAESAPGLWTVGILNSLSSGILIWVSVVELLADEWMHGTLEDAGAKLTAASILALCAGAGSMSLLGYWA
ncbi:Zinc/iron permease [Dipodascopsis uninucleata]